MLANLTTTESFRSLDQNSFPKDTPFGTITVLFGHNGSGKSSLATLLYDLSEGQCTQNLVWQDEHGNRNRLSPGDPLPQPIHVFTKKWVQKNLASFLDGNSATAIFTLGAKSTSAKQQEKELKPKVSKQASDLEDTQERLQQTKDDIEQTLKEARDDVYKTLSEYDHERYSKARYNARTLPNYFQNCSQTTLETDELKSLHAELNEQPRKHLDINPPPLQDIKQLVKDTEALLERDITSKLLPELLRDRELEKWIEDGLAHHQDHASCHFCEKTLNQERLDQLKQHFDRSRTDTVLEAKSLIAKATTITQNINHWVERLPDHDRAYPEFQHDLAAAVGSVKEETQTILINLGDLTAALETKRDAPEEKVKTTLTLSNELDLELLNQAMGSHNSAVDNADSRRSQQADRLCDHILSMHYDSWNTLNNRQNQLLAQQDKQQSDLDQLKADLHDAQVRQQSSADMAQWITEDLAQVFGKNHLEIQPTHDGKSYVCFRNGHRAEHLSEGERNVLALTYFLRSLEDASTANQASDKERIIILDDPTSSLDREALFAMHSWLRRAVDRWGQTFILTHDFELLRQFTVSLKSRRNSSVKRAKRINSQNEEHRTAAEEESRLPSVTFLQLTCSSQGGDERRTRASRLPEVLLQQHSEYAYLFNRLIEGIQAGPDSADLLLLPNATRRLLETFTSFTSPSQNDFLSQVGALVDTFVDDQHRSVVDFCHHYSHADQRLTTEPMDNYRLYTSLRQCLQFIHDVDHRHYHEMLKVTGHEKADPLSHNGSQTAGSSSL